MPTYPRYGGQPAAPASPTTPSPPVAPAALREPTSLDGGTWEIATYQESASQIARALRLEEPPSTEQLRDLVRQELERILWQGWT